MHIEITIEIIELEENSYHLMIEGTFNEELKGNLIIDTGASKTVLDSSFVTPFVTEVKDLEENDSSGINATITNAQTGIIPYITFSTLNIENFECLLIDLSHVNQVYQKYTERQIAGLIGSDFLLKYKAVIDYEKEKLFLKID